MWVRTCEAGLANETADLLTRMAQQVAKNGDPFEILQITFQTYYETIKVDRKGQFNKSVNIMTEKKLIKNTKNGKFEIFIFDQKCEPDKERPTGGGSYNWETQRLLLFTLLTAKPLCSAANRYLYTVNQLILTALPGTNQ